MAQEEPNSTADIISHLPANVLETILTCLTLRDAVRTSILSKKWRYRWVQIPNLVFDEDTLFLKRKEYNQYMMAINQVLLLHRGPIRKLTLKITCLEDLECSEMDQLISFVSNKSVQEFTLNTLFSDYRLPSCFFSFQQLTNLNLGGCDFYPPTAFLGFSAVTTLTLEGVVISKDTFVKLISNSPLLQSLEFIDTYDDYDDTYEDFEIDVPLLKRFCFYHSFSSIHFRNTPLIEFLSISKEEFGDPENEKSNMIEVFGSLPAIQELISGRCFTRFLYSGGGGLPEKLPFILNQLTILTFEDFDYQEIADVSVVLCLLKSSPNLEELEIRADMNGGDGKDVVELIEAQCYSNISLNRLRRVTFPSVYGVKAELDFFKFILEKSPILEEMYMRFKSSHAEKHAEQLTIVKKLNSFKRASPDSRILIV